MAVELARNMDTYPPLPAASSTGAKGWNCREREIANGGVVRGGAGEKRERGRYEKEYKNRGNKNVQIEWIGVDGGKERGKGIRRRPF